MSNIYILEPQTLGKVLLKTTVGDIDVELWSKETPRTCRNFIQLCLEGYYDNTLFHRLVKGFIVQGGDPRGDGTGGDSVYGAPFKDEFHQRLRFARRGLLAMANAGKDDNGSQFFFTLGPTPELQDKHTLFGKITGDTVFNMLKLEEGLVKEERPVYPHKILKTEVLSNPFPDIEPRVKKAAKEKRKKEKKQGVKNFKLLSFGAEAEEEEEEAVRVNETLAGKGKSTHDILDDPKLSSETETIERNVDGVESDDEVELEEEEIDKSTQLESIKHKLKGKQEKKKPIFIEDEVTGEEKDDCEENPNQQLENIRQKLKRKHKSKTESNDPTATYESYLEEQKLEERQKKYDEIQKEIQSVKQNYHKNKLRKEEEKVEEAKVETNSETIKEYKDEFDKYKNKTELLPKKGAGREDFTLKLLEKFKKKIQTIREDETSEEVKEKVEKDEDAWMKHRLCFQDTNPVLAKDANKKDDDWFQIYDPRNPLNKRRRGETTNKFNKK